MPRNLYYLVTIYAPNQAALVGLRRKQLDLFRQTVLPLRDASTRAGGFGTPSDADPSPAVCVDGIASMRVVGELVRQGFSVNVRKRVDQLPKLDLIDADSWMAQAGRGAP